MDIRVVTHVPKLYRLTQDVKNPHPDRRSTDFFNVPVWKEGTVIEVVIHDHWIDEGSADFPVQRRISMRKFGCYGARSVWENRTDGEWEPKVFDYEDKDDKQGRALWARLEEMPDSLDQIKAAHGHLHGQRILNKLIARGILTLDAVRALNAECDGDAVAEYEAEEDAR